MKLLFPKSFLRTSNSFFSNVSAAYFMTSVLAPGSNLKTDEQFLVISYNLIFAVIYFVLAINTDRYLNI
ncbi:hypothetical protein COS31_01715 [Candidatus Roizmanbacteria bacterium CG02_land_8_20_14_3_00_36_15]|uniref:Uncharacterized protein n=2 Tax=Candidatus Roizmaniibacteriota TaxID=1752723 RepID=A0A2M8KMF7_9BACT|nr:MAG: hypothetical protein COS51_05160 [Candidatus Roizmanbacteria bacterium CG03_land_8_20_14_0_80_36_21]PIV38015.1 MAG: hypothetical protein COS31_01715 [Candidatus Roizmanbacteria bacterium CG02_land_8_20_14_3_00_36_15]PIY69731.1 MAG: hypothetical protein COY89_04785 [Candidatus Roizmanbacteria bacterium CG_4_10_14_0_8_um_filter_36_36]PJC81523.1 MAG: hypothetical protein CO007_04245 [Candidatus Roizmanbacteria bacterium CG_4_8_14_3_um_filter_36_10]PJE61098.1 MAG: hypothetical protein COU86